MRTTRQLTVTLPHELADMVRERVASGEYASESEVARGGRHSLFAGDHVVGAWLRGEEAAA